MKNLQFTFNLVAGLAIATLGVALSMIDPAGTSLFLVGLGLTMVSLLTRPKAEKKVLTSNNQSHAIHRQQLSAKGRIPCK